MKTLLFRVSCLLEILVCSGLLGAASAGAEDWPKEYDVVADTESPDHRYAVLIPSFEKGADGGDRTNYLVDLPAHRLLGKIKGGDAVKGEPRGDLQAYWAPGASRVLLEYQWRREGFRSVVLVEVQEGGTLVQKDLGTLLHEKLDAVVAKHRKGGRCFADLFCRWSPAGQLRVRALGNSPGKTETDASYAALFQGTYDLKAHKWTVVDARPINDSDEDGLSALFNDEEGTSQKFDKEEDRADRLDMVLNEVYDGLRALLPPARFAQVKKEQIAWLKKRDAAGSVKEKADLLEARVKELRDLAW